MKLKNKKTGEIGYLIVGKGSDHYVVANNEWHSCGEYNSLAELNEEWCDYEEPKEYWFINSCGAVEVRTEEEQLAVTDMHKQFGNYFETREEAKRALEKLKAWERLKYKGFRFKGWRTADLGADKYYFVITAESDVAEKGDLDLLFGGEI